ncbi:MAG: M23 family metallopeptidase [Negativicutes bacterium]|nr:M23 family metallopeptidase [Negativicutes bacterium]
MKENQDRWMDDDNEGYIPSWASGETDHGLAERILGMFRRPFDRAQEEGEGGHSEPDDGRFDVDPLERMRIRHDARTHIFGWVRVYDDGSPKGHQGVDLYAPAGTPVKAVAKGTVADVGTSKDYGNYIVIRFAKGGRTYYALYGHLSDGEVMAKLKVGVSVKAGQVLGTAGNTGNARGMKGEDAHLHFEVATSGAFGPGMGFGRVDPMPFFRAKLKVQDAR